MKVKARHVKIMVMAVIVIFLLSGMVFAANGSKTVKVFYQNIKIVINGTYFSSEEKPFLINGTTYVPLRLIGEALGAKIKWDRTTSTISITMQAADPQEVARLKAELAEKEKQLATLKAAVDKFLYGTWEQGSGSTSLEELEDELMDDYDELEDVEIDDIKLEGDESDVEVVIEVDLDDDNQKAWEKLTNRDILEWLEDLVDDIQKELDEDTDVEGEIINVDGDDETLISFEKDGKDDLEVDFEDDDYRDNEAVVKDVEGALEGETYYIDNYKFEVDYVDYDVDDDEITVRIAATQTDIEDEWQGIDDDIEYDVENICEDIADEFMDEADVEPEKVKIYIYTKEWKRLASFTYDVDAGRLD